MKKLVTKPLERVLLRPNPIKNQVIKMKLSDYITTDWHVEGLPSMFNIDKDRVEQLRIMMTEATRKLRQTQADEQEFMMAVISEPCIFVQQVMKDMEVNSINELLFCYVVLYKSGASSTQTVEHKLNQLFKALTGDLSDVESN